MIAPLLVTLALGQYVRTTESSDASKCLWWNENTNIHWTQNKTGNPETTGETEFVAFERAFATWQAQFDTCGSLTFTEDARTNTRNVGYYTNTTNENVIVYRTKLCTGIVPANDPCFSDDDCGSKYDCWQFSSSAIAMTTASYDPATARILDADIEMNAKNFIFTTVDSPACVAPNYSQSCVATDVQNTATHEIGHFVGLGHISTVPGSTMAPRADTGETSKRTLDPGTKQFVCDVYPKGQPAKDCMTVALTSDLGTRAPGCSTEPGILLTALALVLLRRR